MPLQKLPKPKAVENVADSDAPKKNKKIGDMDDRNPGLPHMVCKAGALPLDKR